NVSFWRMDFIQFFSRLIEIGQSLQGNVARSDLFWLLHSIIAAVHKIVVEHLSTHGDCCQGAGRTPQLVSQGDDPRFFQGGIQLRFHPGILLVESLQIQQASWMWASLPVDDPGCAIYTASWVHNVFHPIQMPV